MNKMVEPKLFPDSPPVPPAAKKEKKDDSAYQSLSKIITDLSARLKIVEERYSNLIKKTQLTDQNLIDSERQFSNQVRDLNEEIIDAKRQISDLLDKIMVLTGEIEGSVKEEDFRELQKYIELWQPTKFMTREEFEKIISKKKTKSL